MRTDKAVVPLPAREPFDFSKSVSFLCSFAPGEGDQQVASGRLHKALRVAGRDVWVEVGPGPGGVAVEISADGLDDSLVELTKDRVRFWLSLDDNLSGFYRVAQDDPGFAPVVEQLHGYHQVKFATPWENVAWAILATRCPLAVARASKDRLVEALSSVTADGLPLPFPDAEQVAQAGRDRVAELVGNQRKADYLLGAAHKWPSLSEQELRHGGLDEATRMLTSLPGIGPWSAQFVLVRGLGRMEILPDDKALCRAAARAYGRAVSPADLPDLAERYGSQRGYWAHYLRASG